MLCMMNFQDLRKRKFEVFYGPNRVYSYIKISEKVAKSNYYEDKSSCCVNYGNCCVTLADELPKMRVQNKGGFSYVEIYGKK